ncbi:hypothetical protein DWX58_03415 [Pseudoflavonifractor sp. AF19-9AC]|uniref:hypothetical protein n=1 Tax=Pseudoflavonifractor sp. AF19-9AC TaxID=2292244 RepID=UPI000E51344E|nr:hypothetical protein [Pseudoflavonifractor sp. AF19-9AC]RHR10460.1 hypothetical protein DWX58_03415 [Pseudoflavonifractor sp. AF19-9AC]
MASGQTANFGLNQWAAEDQVICTEFNEDNAKIDEALGKMSTKAEVALKAELVVGSYTGNGASSRTISLGFRPKAVYVCKNDGTTKDITNTAYEWHYGGLAVDGSSLVVGGKTVLSIYSSGFNVYRDTPDTSVHILTNVSGVVYHYFAIK